jgi:hypothetical protein
MRSLAMTSTGLDVETRGAATEKYPGYCAAHAAAAAQYGWDFVPFRFLGCAGGCAKPDNFDVKTQPHLCTDAEEN